MDSNEYLEDVVWEAKQQLKAGNPREAVRILRAREDDGGSDPKWLTMLGTCLCMTGHHAEAQDNFRKVLDLAPSAAAHFNLGEAYLCAGDVANARICFTNAITMEQTYGRAIEALQAIRNFGSRPEGPSMPDDEPV